MQLYESIVHSIILLIRFIRYVFVIYMYFEFRFNISSSQGGSVAHLGVYRIDTIEIDTITCIG